MRPVLYGEHVGGVELDHRAALYVAFGNAQDGEEHPRTVIEPHPAALHVYRGVERQVLRRIRIEVDFAVIRERPRGAVGHGAAYGPALARNARIEGIVQIVFTVGRAADVGGVHAAPAPVSRVVALFIDYTLEPPVAEIVCRSRPRDIVVHAEPAAVEPVVRAIYVYAAVEHVRFAVGDVFPARQIGIESLIFHFTTLQTYL